MGHEDVKGRGAGTPPLAGEPPALVPARMVNEVLYCERLMYLEWAQGEFDDNVFTIDGRTVHRRADQPGGELPKAVRGDGAGKGDEGGAGEDERPYEARSVWLSSEALGLTARIDVVEGDGSGRVLPIEYKRGSVPDVPHQAYPPERAQICAQVLLLREHGYTCDEGAIYFAGSKQRVPVVIDEALVAETTRAIARAREVVALPVIPPPLVSSPKCNGCSLVGICLPDETNLLRRLDGGPAFAKEPDPEEALDTLIAPGEEDPWDLVGPPPPEPLRRLHPARDDRLPVYVQDQGGRVSLEGERLIITGRKEGRAEARLANTSHVVLMGNVQVSTQALRELISRGIPVSFFTMGGYYIGRAAGLEHNNVELRVAQHRAAEDPERCLRLARGFIASKVRNGRTLLRRNMVQADGTLLGSLEQLAKKAEEATSIATLLGVEGAAARTYFGAFSGMLKGEDHVLTTFDMEGRNRRPPRDPVNALLSLAYALLAKDMTVTLGAVGLDAMLGFYHRPRFGRPALALDLMEELRPILADSVVIGVINNGVVGRDDFVFAAGAAALKPAARRRFLLAYERRMDQLVTHPVFGYRISYRRVLEVQARLLGRCLLGEIEGYPEFRTR